MDKDDKNNNNESNSDIDFEQQAEDGVQTFKSTDAILAVLGTPNKAAWFKCNSKFQMELTLCKGSVGSGANAVTRTYLVAGKTPDIHTKLKQSLDNCHRFNCVLFCTTNKFWGIWSYRVIQEGEQAHIAHVTAATQFERACKGHIKMRYLDHSQGYHGVDPADTELFAKKEPTWPDESKWKKILNDAFRGHVIKDLEHPVYKSAIGEHQ